MIPSDAWRDREVLADAFAAANREIRDMLTLDEISTVYVTVGAPGSGKFDAARRYDLPGNAVIHASHTFRGARRALAQRIRIAGKIPIAVWCAAPLSACLARNARRPENRRVPEVKIEAAHRRINASPPTADGPVWLRVLVVQSAVPTA